jgi:hypothetical protein
VIPYRREIDRGVVTLQAQVRELAHDMAELKGETRTWQAAHDTQHQSEARERISGRRWMITTSIAALVGLVAVLGLLIDIASKLH